MEKKDLQVIKYGFDGVGKKYMLFVVPVKINDTWEISQHSQHKGYTKIAQTQAEALAIRDNEVLPVCTDK